MTQPKSGDTVRVHFTGRLADGRIFASSRAREPLELTVGQGTLMPSVENVITRMEPGEARTVTIPAERAYGPYQPELMFTVDRTDFPEEIEPEAGQKLRVRYGDKVAIVRVAAVSDDQVTIDANHPLAGENVTFELELLEIRHRRARRRG